MTTPIFAWVLIAFVTMPNGGSTSSIVPGIATPEACHTLAGQLGLPNHQCVSYPAAGGQPSAPEATNTITVWGLQQGVLTGSQNINFVSNIASEKDCQELSEQMGGYCFSYQAPAPKIIRRKIVPSVAQSRGLFW